MTADGNHEPPTRMVKVQPAPPADSPPADSPPGLDRAREARPTRPARPPSRTWWILPYTSGALAVLVVAGVIIGLRYNSGPAQPAALSTTAAMPAEEFPDALFGQMTDDLQDGNETAFLGLAAASARPALTSWWDNLKAIGFTTGAVIPTVAIDAVHLDSHDNGTTVVLAGAHSPLDPVNLNGKPQVPMTRYRIGLHFASASAIGQITSWQPLDDAPWDLGTPLYVRKAAGLVVAGLPADRALVDQILPVAETAAAYDLKMMHHVSPNFLQQQGFVVFVSGSASVRDGWFATVPQPSGWPPQYLGARPVQLLGPYESADTPVLLGQSSLVDNIADDNMGGVRVVLTPAEPATAATLHAETVTLVGDFMLDIQATQDEKAGPAEVLKPVPSWPVEGLAVAAESLFEANPDPVPAVYDWGTLTAELRALPRSYRSGTYPTSADLFGPSAAADQDWGEVAASAYEYIDSRYNMPKMMVSGMVLWLGDPTPFGNVFKSGTNANNLKFFGIHSIRLGWRPWLSAF